MKNMIKGMLLAGFLVCFSTYSSCNFIVDIALKAKRALAPSLFDCVFEFFEKIIIRINKEESGNLQTYLNNNKNLSPDKQIDKMIEYIVPHMNDDEKLEFCKKINTYSKPGAHNPFSDFYRATIVNSEQSILIVKKETYGKIFTNTQQYRIDFHKLNKLNEEEFSQFIFALFYSKIDKMEQHINCSRCYTNSITETEN